MADAAQIATRHIAVWNETDQARRRALLAATRRRTAVSPPFPVLFREELSSCGGGHQLATEALSELNGERRARDRMTDKIAYKVLTSDEWAALNAGAFQGAPIDVADGFIHLSTALQITETVDRHFSGRQGLIVAAIDLATLGDAVRWEPSRHGQLFPHVYTSLVREVVIAWCPLERDADGTVRLPA